ncbi:uncharacterized protein PV07_04336 [Cladophialophora immunda]|uniref:Uncharacterized protein n=1 Tax=Cladophialophora immunda TaxID=569365 RepID=A0A0D2CNH8_9EURO|nr:uncharacterized protein PV07_04336 [Cladophialophora immunda]KIW32818.1 hypothetical protein PV07_04336 [Cladophialophora immunda]OQU95401.1 hypothetical protein CLAIMM_01618 [Cladophialophora immunda]
MPAAVPSTSIAPLIVTSTTGTTIQALDYLTGETSGMATVMAANYNQEKTTTKEKKRHWWSRIRKGRPCRQMETLETAQPSRSSSRGPRPLDEDMFPRRIRTNSSQSVPTVMNTQAAGDVFGEDSGLDAMAEPPVDITTAASPSSSVLTSSVDSSPRSSCSSSNNSFGSDASRTTIDGARSSMSSDRQSRASGTSVARLYEALGTRAIMKEQKKLQNYRARQGILDDRALDTVVLGGAFVIM